MSLLRVSKIGKFCDISWFDITPEFPFLQDQMNFQLDHKTCEVGRLESQVKQQKVDVEKADQANNDIRGKMLDKELEVESLQVTKKPSI